jgi:site-specific recombinase XerD
MLEYFFKGSIVKDTQRVILVENLIAQTISTMEEMGYSKEYLKKIAYSYKLFMNYSIKNDCKYYSEKLALVFLEEYCNIFSDADKVKYAYQDKKRAIAKLDEMYKYNQISSQRLFARKKYQFYGCLQSSIESYLAWKQIKVSKARMQSIKLYLERFSFYISKIDSIKNILDLKSEHINQFIESCSIYTHHTIYATVVCLRNYIIYLEKNEYINNHLSTKLPKIIKKRERTYPSAFTKDEVETLLNSIKRDNSKERRDYAMLLLAARIGLRASDITNLKFNNIDWEKNQINIVQQKTKAPLTLPLLQDVGKAIIDYVKNGRPNVNDLHIFIRESRPYTKMKASSLHMIVDGYLKRAKIKIPTGKKHGPHALRHSIATLLLENNIPISTIKEILAHKSSETTKIYLKVAQKQLLECALNVEFKSTNKD